MNKQGFTLVEILIVMVIAGLGLMTVAPKIAEHTILTNQTELFFDKIIELHLKAAKQLNNQVVLTGYKGSDNLLLYDGNRVSIPEGVVTSAYINDGYTGGSEYHIYFYTDGVFDHFLLKFGESTELEGIPGLHRTVLR